MIMVTHTHWDREWYFSKEEWSFRLIRLFDELLDVIETEPEYDSFWFDGQTIAVEDYLGLRPENRGRLEKALSACKILIGPHYIQVDEHLTGGEAIIKNLELGFGDMKKYNQNTLIGYLPDTFGHISQMPQIFRNFGIDISVFWRGYDNRELKQLENRWRSPDGSEVDAICLVQGYSCASGLGTLQPYHSTMDQQERIDQTLDLTAGYSAGDAVMMMNGIDHSLPTVNLSQKLKDLEKRFPGYAFKHGSMPEYLDLVRKKCADGCLFDGELPYAPRLDAVMSSRPAEKVLMRKNENTLVNYAEPLNAIAAISAGTKHGSFLNRAWKLLLKNRFHDSVCGCHADVVARDFFVREQRCLELADGVSRESISAIIGCDRNTEEVSLPAWLSIFNPVAHPHETVFDAIIEVPVDSDFVPGALKRGDDIYPVQVRSRTPVTRRRFHRDINPTGQEIIRFEVSVGPVDFNSGVGLYTFEVMDEVDVVHELPVTFEAVDGAIVLRNNRIEAVILPDGSVDILDIESNREYPGLNRLFTIDDLGDLYKSELSGERCYATPGKVKVVSCGSVGTEVEVAVELSGVAALLRYRLEENSEFVNIKFSFDNRRKNYRLSAEIPLPDGYRRVRAHTPFDLVERDVIPFDSTDVVEEGQVQRNCFCRDMQYMLAASSKESSLYALSRGIYEYTYERPDQLTLTLFRAAGIINAGLVMHDASGGQSFGPYTVEYAIGVCDSIEPAGLIRRGMSYNLSPHATQVTIAPVELPIFRHNIPGAVYSVIRYDGDAGVNVRLYNPGINITSGEFSFGSSPVRVNEIDALGRRIRKLDIKGQGGSLEIPPGKIIYLNAKFAMENAK